MEITAKLKYLRIAPRKVRMVTDMISGKQVEEAQSQLLFARKKAAKPIRGLLKAAVASAENDFQLNKSNLFISNIFVDEGPKLKRSRPASRGHALPILKRSSHITLVLDEIKKGLGLKKKKKTEKKEKVKKQKDIKRAGSKRSQKRQRKSPSLAPGSRIVKKRVFKRKAF